MNLGRTAAALALRLRARRQNPAAPPVALVFAEADVVRPFLDLDGPASIDLATRIVRGRAVVERIAAGSRPEVARLALERHAAIAALGMQTTAFEAQPEPVVFALPLTTTTIALLAWLRARTSRCLAIEATGLGEFLRRPLCDSSGPGSVEFHTGSGLVRRNRSRAPGERLTFVTFPDHHQARREASRDVMFLGEPQRFAVTEPLLHFVGATPIVSFDAAPAAGAGVTLRRYAWTDPGSGPSEADAQAVLTWLAERMESVLRAAPQTALSFAAMSWRANRVIELGAAMDRKLVEAFLRAWHADPRAPLDDDLYAWSLGELGRPVEVAAR